MTAETPTRSERQGRFDPGSFEEKWRERWAADDLYRARDDDPRERHYLLTMYPYTSGDLHVGHWYAVTGPDIVARMRRMEGLNVMFPMGFDSFGLPAENAAIERGIHPATWTSDNIARMRAQFRTTGCSFDWSREVVTSDPEYYRWTQWIFLQLLNAGLAYRAMAAVDWCPKDQVVLAREQVLGAERRCWRCGTPVVKRDLEQWFFRITKYADELLAAIDDLDWPDPIKLMQRNWIGRSEGAEIAFPVAAAGVEPIRVFTTRPDTVFGATFMVLAPEHPYAEQLTTDDARSGQVRAYIEQARRETEIERLNETREKTGVFTGAYALNPMTHEQIPIWVADYVLPGYGTGAIMGVPAHDERDYAFARRYDLPIRYVVLPRGGDAPERKAFVEHTADELLVDSGEFTGMQASEAIPAITAKLEHMDMGGPAVTYRLRDWLVSRQRYWGPPIPIVYCPDHGAQPVPEDELPVRLPADIDFAPTGGVSPLASQAEWLTATCPTCGEPARRETDTMDTFVDSAWYFLRYVSPTDDERAWDPAAADVWLPVDLYTGGAEHAVLHLLYGRFMVKALRDLGLLSFDEPWLALRNQGQILGADHSRMSKSRGNVQAPDELAARYGSDTVRAFLMFIGPWDQGGPWSSTGIDGVHRLLGRVWSVAQPANEDGTRPAPTPGPPEQSLAGEAPGRSGPAATELLGTVEEVSRGLRRAIHMTIRDVTEDYAAFHFNTAIARLMELTNALVAARQKGLSGTDAYVEAVDTLLLLLAPVAPHVTEELWSRRDKPYSIHQQPWPSFDPELAAAETIELPVQVDGKVRDRLVVTPDTPPDEIERMVLASARVQSYLRGREPRRVIQVAGKLVNVVTPRD